VEIAHGGQSNYRHPSAAAWISYCCNVNIGLLQNYQVLPACPFVGLFAARVPPFVKAAREPSQSKFEGRSQGWCVIKCSDATVAAGFAGFGLWILSLLPISIVLAQILL